jgi:hypothetical protein
MSVFAEFVGLTTFDLIRWSWMKRRAVRPRLKGKHARESGVGELGRGSLLACQRERAGHQLTYIDQRMMEEKEESMDERKRRWILIKGKEGIRGIRTTAEAQGRMDE